MTSKMPFILVLIIILIGTLSLVSADVIEPGKKTISYDYQVSNIQDYPDYVFILHGIPNPELEIINTSSFSFYKLSTVRIYALTKNDYNQVQLEKMNDTQLEEFLNNDSRVSRSPMELKGTYDTISDTDPLESVLMVIKIKSIKGNQLELLKEKLVYTYNNGQTEEKPFTNQNQIPAPPKNQESIYSYVLYFLLPILALIVIIIIIWKRKN